MKQFKKPVGMAPVEIDEVVAIKVRSGIKYKKTGNKITLRKSNEMGRIVNEMKRTGEASPLIDEDMIQALYDEEGTLLFVGLVTARPKGLKVRHITVSPNMYEAILRSDIEGAERDRRQRFKLS